MAQFLTTTGNSFYIEKIILEAKESITLITPYLKLTNLIVERLQDADIQNIRITIIYGKNELHAVQKNILENLKNAELYFCLNLHAKCYFNENLMIISSMNLYEFSERNNREMGILVEKEKDTEIFESAMREVESIKNISKVMKRMQEIVEVKEVLRSEANTNFNEAWNFYIPTLFKKLKASYPEREILLNKEIEIKNYPVNNINVELGATINFRFVNNDLFEIYKGKFRDNLKNSMPSTRFYWNYYVLNIYPPKNMEVTQDETGKQKMSDYFVEVIETFAKICR